MGKYYEAYEERYRKIHTEENKAWAGEVPTYILKDYFEKYGVSTKSKILELGCGEGQNAMFLLENGYNVFASDVSKEAIVWCKNNASKKKLPTDNFFVLDVLNNKMSKKFDIIYSISVLHMLVLDEDRKKFLDFIYSHLTKNGKAIISIMGDGINEKNDSDISKSFDLTDRPFEDKIVQVATTSCRIVNWDTFKNELNNSGLKIVENLNTSEISGFNNSMLVVCEKI